MLTAKALPASALFALLVFVRPVSADPITITSGTVSIAAPRGPFESVFFTLVGPGFSAAGSQAEDASAGSLRCNFAPCGAGETITAPARVSFFNALGDVRIDGTSIGSFVSGSFTFESSPLTIPAGPFGSALACPFTATGTLNIDRLGADGTRVPGQTTTVRVQGQGIVTAHLQARGEGYAVPSFTYEFAAANPTPEPGTLVLLATGSAWTITRRRRASRMPV
jgi:hypothetical protein